MVDEARGDLQLTLAPGSQPIDWTLGRQITGAIVVAVAVLAVLLTVTRASPLERLPDYASVGAAFVLLLVFPGYFVQRALLSSAHPCVKLAAMPCFGLALIALPGFIALELHTNIDGFAVAYSVLAAIVCGASVLFWRDGDRATRQPDRDQVNPLVFGALLVVVAGIVTTPLWANDRIAGDFDDWTYMAYASDFVVDERMNEHEPFFGTNESPTPRMRDNVWVLTEALISDVSSVPPNDVLLEYIRPVLTVFALLATFAVTWTLFRSTTIAILAMLFQVGYALIDLSAHEGMGRNLFMRISEDKMVGAFLLFPLGVVFVARFVERRDLMSVVGFSLIVLAISFVHPVPLVFLAITIGALAVLRFVQHRDMRETTMLGVLLVPVAAGSIWPLVQRQLLQGSAPELFGTEDSAITFRDTLRVIELGHGLVIGNYHMIMHPLVIFAIILAPVAWLLARKQLGNEMIAAMTGGALIAFFVPLFSTPLSNVMTPQTLWKVPWMIPISTILAYVCVEGTRRLTGLGAISSGRLRRAMTMAVVPATLLIVILGAALLVQEQYIRADGGTFYDWTRPDSYLPGPDESIFLGGLDRGRSGTWRLDPYLEELAAYMDENMPAGSVVLAEPNQLNHLIPGILPKIYPVDFGGAAGEGQRREDTQVFIGGNLKGAELDQVLERWGVDYIAVRETQPANEHLLEHPFVVQEAEVAPYLIYRVGR